MLSLGCFPKQNALLQGNTLVQWLAGMGQLTARPRQTVVLA